ncbi:hypothetical protein ACOCLD_16985 [Pseudomonas sp. MAC6]|jgi:hypothetical protein|uniref:hypothetical protein n=1 Tax=Pseudomonas sp. MAC6 TaxID=3401633 RepID=UPI003BF4E59D
MHDWLQSLEAVYRLRLLEAKRGGGNPHKPYLVGLKRTHRQGNHFPVTLQRMLSVVVTAGLNTCTPAHAGKPFVGKYASATTLPFHFPIC